MALTTRDKVQKYLLITIDESFHDQVDEWIQGVTAYMEKATGRKLEADGEASERVYDGDGTRELDIDEAVELDAVTVDETELTLTNILEYPANRPNLDGGFDKLRIKSTAMGSFAVGEQNVVVEARWGAFDTSEEGAGIPLDITHAATVFVAGIINASNQHEGEVQSETIGRYSVTYKTESEKNDFKQAMETLKRYRRFNFNPR